MVLAFISVFFNTASAQLVAVTGKYTGTGNNNNAIVGLGFKPDFLLINSDQYHAQITTSTFPADNTKSMNGGSAKTGLIKSLDQDGFTLDDDNDVNKAGKTYNYLALKAEAGVVEMGSYIGNNTDDRNITGTSFQPEMVIIISEDNSQKPVYSANTMGADQSMNFLNSGFVSNRVQGFNSNGFQVGKNNAVNQSGTIYHFVAFRSMPGMVYIGYYTGDGVANRIIPEPGTGSFVMIKRDGKNAMHRNRDMPVNSSYSFKNSSSVSNRIKRNTSGGFELGDDNDVNQSGREYHYLKLIGLSTILPIDLISFDARASKEEVELQWEIAAGQGVSSFVVERSTDQLTFKEIGEILSLPGNNSGGYDFTDKYPVQGYSYYRLKITGPAGKIEYSELKRIYIPLIKEENNFTIYPNPVTGNYVRIEQRIALDTLRVDLFDLSGQKLDSRLLTNGNSYFEFKNILLPGVYYLIGSANNSILFKEKIIKL